MNKAEFIDELSKQVRLSKTQSEEILDAALEIIQRVVSRGQEVKLVGFGTFSQLARKSRTARNPKTGDTMVVPALTVPKFKPGKEFRSLVGKIRRKKAD